LPDHHYVIEFSDVAFSYSDGKTIFRDLSLRLESGRFYLISGPSGSGKSTFLRLINRLEEPSSGGIFFDGRKHSAYSLPELRRSLLYIQQTPTAMDDTVAQNLLLGFTFKNNRDLPVPDKKTLRGYLDNFLLTDVTLEANAQTLSVGQMQRLCFIRGLLLDPQVLLLDEPASALDEESSRIVEETAERMGVESGLTVLMVSHRRFEPQQAKCSTIRIVDGRAEIIE